MKHLHFYLVMSIFGSLVLGIIWGGGMAWLFSRNAPQFAVVDMQALIVQQSQHLTKTHAGKVSTRQVQDASEQLKEKLETFALKHDLILLNKGAVMGGNLPDYTAEIAENIFPDHAAALHKLIKEEARYRDKINHLFPKLQPINQENQP